MKIGPATTVRVGALAAQGATVLISEAFNGERDTAQGAIGGRVEIHSRDADRVVYAVHNTRHAQGLRGTNTNKREHTITTFDWNLQKRTTTWTYQGPHGRKVDVHGGIAIIDHGDHCVIDETMTITVAFPIIGGKIETLVIGEMKKGFGVYADLVNKYVAG